jgi:hypothetical protein
MRRLPDGTHHCPSCGSEVVPLDAQATLPEPDEHGQAYWAGWADGRFRELRSFVENPSLAKWETLSERLAHLARDAALVAKPAEPAAIVRTLMPAKSSSDEEGARWRV